MCKRTEGVPGLFQSRSLEPINILEIQYRDVKFLRDFGPFEAGEIIGFLVVDFNNMEMVEWTHDGQQQRKTNITLESTLPPYDREFGDEKVCACGHPYYRHFDTYEQMDPVGCKYCDCSTFKEPTE